jgi:EAL domain-containing protein (putative c-di-GMP-specific phosphodiesterase class I)/CheY-like chemotaxis protein
MTTPPRLLVLDDDPVMREIIAVLAERQGFDTALAATTGEFFDQLQQWRPTHITMDLELPTQDGIEVMRSLASSGCRAAITIISGIDRKVLESSRRVAVARGLTINGVLSKPFRHDALKNVLAGSVDAPAAPAIALPLADGAPPAGALVVTAEVIEEALDKDQFVLHYQPKIELATGEVAGVEALLRWQHPLLGLVMPDGMIPAIEKIGLISRITQRVLDLGLSWFARMPLPKTATLAVNISALELSTLTLADALGARCAALGVEPKRVMLELTETSAMRHPDIALATLTRLRIRGFGLAIDDFGTGYSSMVQLARLPFSAMKIDKSFVLSMETSDESRKIVSSIIGLGHSLGLKVIAEGVENAATAAELARSGCDIAQGFWFGKPMPGDALGDWLSAWQPAAWSGLIENAGVGPATD